MLYELLRYEKDKGYIVWVLGPAAVFDSDSRKAVVSLIEHGVVNEVIRPVFIYSIDISEFAVNKLRDRGSLEVTSIVTNIQDFLVNLERNLVK